jgi:hypothetical protein
LKAETKSRCALIEEIYGMWYASRFGCIDNKRRVFDPYFAGLDAAYPRISFGAAAQHCGMKELRSRFERAVVLAA